MIKGTPGNSWKTCVRQDYHNPMCLPSGRPYPAYNTRTMKTVNSQTARVTAGE